MSNINESLLEMYYFSPTINAFKDLYGKRAIKFYKPTQHQEGWLGFDQAFVKSEYSDDEFLDKIKENIEEKGEMEKFYFGYFMQYKKMKKVQRIVRPTSISIPNHFTEEPYFRFELKTQSTKNNKVSQHKTLMLLHQNVKNAFVYYVSPMLFELSAFTEPNLDDLRIINIDSAPPLANWDLDKRHFIMYENEKSEEPFWCSEPVKGKEISFTKWIENMQDHKRLSGEDVLKLISDTKKYSKEHSSLTGNRNENMLPASLTIVEVQN